MLEYSKKIIGFVKADDNSTSSNSNLILYQNQYAKVILGEARGNQYPWKIDTKKIEDRDHRVQNHSINIIKCDLSRPNTLIRPIYINIPSIPNTN